ncbi:MAG: hypothetical protein R3E88_00820 [Myxococcota bacterium]
MTAHPLIELANDASVKAAGSFREAAEALTGARLAEMYREEKQAAAAEVRADVAHFVGHDGGFEGDIAIDEKELAIAVYNQCELDQVTLKLLDGVPPRDADDVDDEGTPPTEVTLLDYAVPVTALSPRKIKARMRVVSALDLLGVANDDRLVVARCRVMPPKSTKGDTPLRALLEGLAQCAVAEAWRESLAAQIAEKFERTVAPAPPSLLVLANNRYWEIYRKRSLQSAGPWMAALRKLGGEVESALGIPVTFGSIKLYGDPPWRLRQGKLILDSDPALRDGLEPVGDELRPKSKARATSAAEREVVEPDLSRPPLPYSARELYYAGDRVSHPKLGEGVVQRQLGPNKAEVLFAGGEVKVLVMGRG